MDECLPLGSMDAPTSRMLLEKERAHRQGLEQEIARLRSGLARQNERIVQLEAENAELRRMVAEQQGLITGLQEQNALLRQQVALLEAETTRLRGTPRPPKPLPGTWPSERTKTEREETLRKKRDDRHNRGRHRMAQVDERMTHAVETCPRCGRHLSGGWVHRRLQVIELPPAQPAIVTEHVLAPPTVSRVSEAGAPSSSRCAGRSSGTVPLRSPPPGPGGHHGHRRATPPSIDPGAVAAAA